jgi:hypothetical protein
LQVLQRDYELRAGNYARARKLYAETFPHLLARDLPKFTTLDAVAAIELALVLQHTGESEQAEVLLEHSDAFIHKIGHLCVVGFGFADVEIHALRGEKAKALSAMREPENACRWAWRYYRDYDPALASIRNEPEFKAVFADIERDMARQRAALAARPKDAPLEIVETGT